MSAKSLGGRLWKRVVWVVRETYWPHYLFFLRFPLIVGVLLVLLPWVWPQIAPSVLRNMFVMGWQGVVATAFAATVLALGVVVVGRLIWVSAPSYVALEFSKPRQNLAEALRAQITAVSFEVDADAAWDDDPPDRTEVQIARAARRARTALRVRDSQRCRERSG